MGFDWKNSSEFSSMAFSLAVFWNDFLIIPYHIHTYEDNDLIDAIRSICHTLWRYAGVFGYPFVACMIGGVGFSRGFIPRGGLLVVARRQSEKGDLKLSFLPQNCWYTNRTGSIFHDPLRIYCGGNS